MQNSDNDKNNKSDTNRSPNLGQTTRPSNNQQEKENLLKCELCCPAKHRINLKENEKNEKYLYPAKELKNTVDNETDHDTNYNGYSCYSYQSIDKATRIRGKKKLSGANPNYSIIKNGQNTEGRSGDLRRFAVTETPVRNHQSTLVWKTRKAIYNMQP